MLLLLALPANCVLCHTGMGDQLVKRGYTSKAGVAKVTSSTQLAEYNNSSTRLLTICLCAQQPEQRSASDMSGGAGDSPEVGFRSLRPLVACNHCEVLQLLSLV